MSYKHRMTMREPTKNKGYNPLMVVGLGGLSLLADLLIIGIGASFEYQFPSAGKLIVILALASIIVNTIVTYKYIKRTYS